MVFFTKGCFVRDPKLRYEGGNFYAYNGQDTDYWSFYEARDLIKAMDSQFNAYGVKMLWKHKCGSLDEVK